MKLVIWCAVSLAVGVGLGYWLRGGPEAPAVAQGREAPPPPPAPAAAPPAAPVGSPRAPVALAPQFLDAARRPLAMQPVPPVPAAPTLAADARMAELERQLAEERAMRRGAEGDRIEVPPGLEPRFRDEALLVKTFNEALKRGGFSGEVTSVDCTEHPCVVFGNGFGERGDLEQLRSKSLLGPYEKDSFSTFGFGAGDGDPAKRFFGVAVLPNSAQQPLDEATRKRIGFRVQQMYEASRPRRGP